VLYPDAVAHTDSPDVLYPNAITDADVLYPNANAHADS